MAKRKRIKLDDRKIPPYTKGEEVFNMVTHIVGGGIGVAATALCVVFAAIHGNVYGVIGSAIFGAMMIILYTMSSLYHGLSPKLKAKKVFQIFDHCSIFLLIAGTYTPIALVSLREYNPFLGWGIFGFVWAVAILGVVLNSIDLEKYKIFSMISYLGLGWCIVLAGKVTFEALGLVAFIFLLLGGVSYTIGACFFAFKKKYMHSIFHIFVDIGSVLHVLCILLFVI